MRGIVLVLTALMATTTGGGDPSCAGQAVRSGTVVYVIGSGDSLSVVSEKVGVDLDDLIDLYDGDDPGVVNPGQIVTVVANPSGSILCFEASPLAQGGLYYVSGPAEAMVADVARRFGLDEEEMVETNGGDRELVEGEVLSLTRPLVVQPSTEDDESGESSDDDDTGIEEPTEEPAEEDETDQEGQEEADDPAGETASETEEVEDEEPADPPTSDDGTEQSQGGLETETDLSTETDPADEPASDGPDPDARFWLGFFTGGGLLLVLSILLLRFVPRVRRSLVTYLGLLDGVVESGEPSTSATFDEPTMVAPVHDPVSAQDGGATVVDPTPSDVDGPDPSTTPEATRETEPSTPAELATYEEDPPLLLRYESVRLVELEIERDDEMESLMDQILGEGTN